MSTKHFVDIDGNSLGAFTGGIPKVPHVEVPTGPAHGYDKWDGVKWIPYVQPDSEAAQQALDETQGQVALIGEEVIELLLAKNIITVSELKPESQALLVERKANKAKVK